MYHFAIVALLALAVIKVVDLVCDNVEIVERFRAVLTFVLAIGTVVWLDYSVFEGWALDIRDGTLGTWLTGFVVAGLTVPWAAVLGWLGHDDAGEAGESSDGTVLSEAA